MASLFTKPFINTDFFAELKILPQNTLTELFYETNFYKDLCLELDDKMHKTFYETNFSNLKRHLAPNYFPDSANLFLSKRRHFNIAVPRIGVMDWSFFFDFYRINNWNFTVVFSDDYEDEFLFYDYPELSESLNIVTYNSFLYQEVYLLAAFGFFDVFFDCFLSLVTFFWYFIYLFFPSFFDDLLYNVMFLNGLFYFCLLFIFNITKYINFGFDLNVTFFDH